MTSQVFRANVGIVIVGVDGRVLEFERSDVPDAWQLPQGGIDLGEDTIDAAWRELREETGLTNGDVTLLAEHPYWLSYELPANMRKNEAMRGQTQKWFYVRLIGDEGRINLSSHNQEFARYRWTALANLAERAMTFRRPIYRALAQHLETLEL